MAQFGFGGLAALFICFMPESPVWLINIGNEEKARHSLRRLGYSEIEATKMVHKTQYELENTKSETEGASYVECFRKSNFRRTIISIMPIAIQALSGVFFVTYYSTYYMQLAGFSDEASFQLMVVQYVLCMLGNMCSWVLVDRVGRRTLTIWGVFFLTIILMLCGGLGVYGSPAAIRGTVAMFLLYNLVFNVTIGATAYTLLCEVATSRLRGHTISLGIATQHLIYVMWAFTLPLLFNPDKANLGAKTAFIFGGIGVFSLVYLWFYQVETRGRSYKDLDELFSKGIHTRDFGNYVTDSQREEE
ncbi:hypothetical protein N8I77_013631 [Diaporthe amygdali]|uniref:Major facilitator superfamily (MFS) profile domain-containing protein n=1 Tax=Phomopsis amygdali TaxID=1214568 RepID=A0AAD9VWM3_PHOAM|nr:hypothetical protein N8I77_013631 [Diaporthe amygdali]